LFECENRMERAVEEKDVLYSARKNGVAFSTPHPTDDMVAWQISFFSGEPVTDQKSGTRRLWCRLGEPRK
jgi:hypothetical protein